MFTGLRTFIMRGNVIDLAVAFVLGVAFASVVDTIVKGVVNPLIAAVFGRVALDDVLVLEVNNAQFYFGAVLGALINFVAVAAAVYFLIVLPMNRLAERRKRAVEPEPEAPTEDVLLLREIRDLLAK